LIPIAGNVLRMPGLPEMPAAEHIDISDDGVISGLS
jgi:formate--tetrahydrofolate ligase